MYKSKYGSTKKYAEWIAQGTKADLLPCKMLIRIEDNKTYIGMANPETVRKLYWGFIKS